MTAMRKVSFLFMMLGIAFAWWIGTRLSSDAVGMAVGVAFGALAGVPTALLVMAASRDSRGNQADDCRRDDGYNQRQFPSPYSPPVIVYHQPAQFDQPAQRQAAPMPTARASQPAQWDQPAQRQVAPMPTARCVVGERENWVDEW